MTDFEPVELESPRGNKHVARSAREFVELTAGHGYKKVHKHEETLAPTRNTWVTPPPVDPSSVAPVEAVEE